MASRQLDFVAPAVAPNLTISFCASTGECEAVPFMPYNVRYEWSNHWVYSHVELPNGNILLTQIREPAWRCGEL